MPPTTEADDPELVRQRIHHLLEDCHALPCVRRRADRRAAMQVLSVMLLVATIAVPTARCYMKCPHSDDEGAIAQIERVAQIEQLAGGTLHTATRNPRHVA